MISTEDIKRFRTIAEFWKALEESVPFDNDEQRVGSKRLFMSGAIAVWTLVRNMLDAPTGLAPEVWNSLTGEITAWVDDESEDDATETLRAAELPDLVVSQQPPPMQDNTAYFEAEVLPVMRQISEVCKRKGIGFVAGFEIQRAPEGVRLAQFVQAGAQNMLSDPLVQAMHVLMGSGMDEDHDAGTGVPRLH
jgi:hypothetical protein